MQPRLQRMLVMLLAAAIDLSSPKTAVTQSAAMPRCEAVPGADAIWQRAGLRFILVGEMHGTTQTPAIFADLVCAAASTRRPVVVALEHSPKEQPAIDAFLTSAEHEAATKALLRNWTSLDGKRSRAMLLMMEELRALQERRLSAVIAFNDDREGESEARHEQRMADALIAATSRTPDALVIALTGNLHASKKIFPEVGSYPLMAMLMPAEATLSLAVTDRGGEHWSGSVKQHGSSGGVRRGVTLGAKLPAGGFDGVLSTGQISTASAPALSPK